CYIEIERQRTEGGYMNNNNKRNKKDNNKFNNKNFLYVLVAALLVMFLFSQIGKQIHQGTNKEVSYNHFLEMLEKGEVKEVLIQADRIQIYPKEQKNELYDITYYTGLIDDEDLTNRLVDAGVEIKGDIPETRSFIM